MHKDLELCGIEISPEKEEDLRAFYNIGNDDVIDFNSFHKLSQSLLNNSDKFASKPEEKEYGRVVFNGSGCYCCTWR